MVELNLSITLLLLVAYLLGSICSAILICKALKLPDPRTLGSGNPGATNVMRIGGKKAAALTLFADAIKGVIPVMIGHLMGFSQAEIGWVGLAAVLGHLFPIFFSFKGGKGVATTLGVIHAWHWPTALIIDAIWLVFAKVFKISSAAAIIAMICLPIILYLFSTHYWVPAVIISILSLYRHRSNIQKLISGQESHIGDQVKADDSNNTTETQA